MQITTPINSDDYKLFVGIINQGIDSHLEAFTKLKHDHVGNRLVLDFHESELHILIRRLREEGSEEAERWADDIEASL